MYILSQKPLALFAACAFKSCVPQVFSCFYSNVIRFSLRHPGQSYKKKYNYSLNIIFDLDPTWCEYGWCFEVCDKIENYLFQGFTKIKSKRLLVCTPPLRKRFLYVVVRNRKLVLIPKIPTLHTIPASFYRLSL